MDDAELLRQIQTMIEAKARRPKAVRLLETVLDIVDSGRDHLRAWASVGDLFHLQRPLAELATPFFTLTAIAHIEAAALRAAKLNDTHPSSISLPYLLNTIEADRDTPYIRSDWHRAQAGIVRGAQTA